MLLMIQTSLTGTAYILHKVKISKLSWLSATWYYYWTFGFVFLSLDYNGLPPSRRVCDKIIVASTGSALLAFFGSLAFLLIVPHLFLGKKIKLSETYVHRILSSAVWQALFYIFRRVVELGCVWLATCRTHSTTKLGSTSSTRSIYILDMRVVLDKQRPKLRRVWSLVSSSWSGGTEGILPYLLCCDQTKPIADLVPSTTIYE